MAYPISARIMVSQLSVPYSLRLEPELPCKLPSLHDAPHLSRCLRSRVQPDNIASNPHERHAVPLCHQELYSSADERWGSGHGELTN